VRLVSGLVARRLVLAAVLAAALAAPSAASAAPSKVKVQLKGAAAPAGELTPTDRVPLPGGATLYRFEQRVSGIGVLGTGAVVSNPPGAPPDLIVDHTKPSVQAPPAPRVSEARALETASSAVGVKRLRGRRSASLAIEPGKGGTLVWRVLVPSARPLGSFEVLVDARSGDVVRKRNMIRDFRTGHAKLFNPNPVVERVHSGSLKGLMGDHRDRDTPLLTRLRRAVKLPRIRGGQHCLRGQWAHAKVGPSGGREVCKPDLRWGRVTRSDDRFEALMTYFHVTRAQKYIHQLGFSNGHHNGIDDKSQVVVADAFKIDNSFFDPVPDRIEFGSGGVDDAEDADVILHEYAHAMQFSQHPQFLESGGGDAGPLQEGSADYWAAVMSSLSPNTHNEDDVCIFDWDGITYGSFFAAKPPYTVGRFCGRRADFMHTVAEAQSFSSDPHYVGQVWSTALWDIRNAIGGFTADQIYLTAQFMYQANEHFNGSNGAGQALLNADQALTGGVNQATICGEMTARGISVPGC
jgi:hypothetical protein